MGVFLKTFAFAATGLLAAACASQPLPQAPPPQIIIVPMAAPAPAAVPAPASLPSPPAVPVSGTRAGDTATPCPSATRVRIATELVTRAQYDELGHYINQLRCGKNVVQPNWLPGTFPNKGKATEANGTYTEGKFTFSWSTEPGR